MTMKLTPKQKEVIKLMREGVRFYFNAVTNVRPWTKGDFGSKAQMAHGKIMRQLERKGLIVPVKYNLAIYIYQLTELGKTIEL